MSLFRTNQSGFLVFVKLVLSLSLGLILCSCQTAMNKKNQWIGGATVAGAVAGAAFAPQDERKEAHAAYWGALSGLVTALVMNSFEEQDKTSVLLEKENAKLKAELDLIHNSKQVLIDQGKGKFKNPSLGESTLSGKRVQWKVYEVDRWSKETAERIYHIDKMIEIEPLE